MNTLRYILITIMGLILVGSSIFILSCKKAEQVQEDKAGGKDLKPKSKKPVLGKEKKKSKTDARKKLAGLKKKTNSSNSNQEIKEAAEEILNAEFEKEIEQIEQKLAEI